MESKTGKVNIEVKIRCRCGKYLDVNAQDTIPRRFTENNKLRSGLIFFVESHDCTCNKHGEKTSKIDTKIFDILPAHLHLARNPKAESEDRWRIYDRTTENYSELSGASTIEECMQKYIDYIKGKKE